MEVENPFDRMAGGDTAALLTLMPAEMWAWLQSPGIFKKLQGTHHELQARIIRTVTIMALLGHRMMVTDGVRTMAQQQALFAQGRSGPGPIVTRADGVDNRSNHQQKLGTSRFAGFGAAADLCFLDGAGKPTWDRTYPWSLYGTIAKAQGLVWGGDWPSKDRPHVELFE